MSYITFFIDGLESFVDLSEYCIIQKSYDCTKQPSIIFHAKHNKDFMVIFNSEKERDEEYLFICDHLLDVDYQYKICPKSIEINNNFITYKLKGE